MPRFHFHIQDGTDSPDTEGVELADLHSARCEAVRLAGALLCDGAEEFWALDDWRLTVTNEDGLVLFSLIFASVNAPVSVRRGAEPPAVREPEGR